MKLMTSSQLNIRLVTMETFNHNLETLVYIPAASICTVFSPQWSVDMQVNTLGQMQREKINSSRSG
jgi:hypothetical protein